MEVQSEQSPLCPLCNRPINLKGLTITKVKEMFFHKGCLFASSVVALQLIYNILIETNPQKIFFLTHKLDFLELREPEEYSEEDIPEIKESLIDSINFHQSEINEILQELI